MCTYLTEDEEPYTNDLKQKNLKLRNLLAALQSDLDRNETNGRTNEESQIIKENKELERKIQSLKEELANAKQVLRLEKFSFEVVSKTALEK